MKGLRAFVVAASGATGDVRRRRRGTRRLVRRPCRKKSRHRSVGKAKSVDDNQRRRRGITVNRGVRLVDPLGQLQPEACRVAGGERRRIRHQRRAAQPLADLDDQLRFGRDGRVAGYRQARPQTAVQPIAALALDRRRRQCAAGGETIGGDTEIAERRDREADDGGDHRLSGAAIRYEESTPNFL